MNLEKSPKLIVAVSSVVLLFSFLMGMILGKVLEKQKKDQLLQLKKELQVQETKSLEKIFAQFNQESFF